ncbi:MAG: hypothetical protein KJ626_00890 [Verrucomicrobia bacterium]|nr:hypothetical protein [Verrucomicrobiota bacterium]
MTEDREASENPADGEAASTPVRSRTERRERAILDPLRTLIRDCLTSEFGEHPFRDAQLDFDLHLKVDPDADWSIEFADPLLDQLHDQCADLVSARGVYQDGRVYCFRTRSALDPASAPPSPLMVFKGYDAMGIPQWHELTQSFIDARDERVDQLYERSPRPLALIAHGNALKSEQLSSFGRASRAYSILAQLVAGYFELDATGRPGNGIDLRLAVTFQIVETRTADGQFALRLNAICAVPGGGTLEELYASGWCEWLKRAQRKAAADLEQIERRVLAARATKNNRTIRRELGRIPAILHTFQVSLERGHRQSRRRTRHVEERRKDRRPVHMALADVAKARAESLYHDEISDTTVVAGDHGRMHVFSQNGRHVTSFAGNPKSIEFRLRTNRWRVLDVEDARLFLSQFG